MTCFDLQSSSDIIKHTNIYWSKSKEPLVHIVNEEINVQFMLHTVADELVMSKLITVYSLHILTKIHTVANEPAISKPNFSFSLQLPIN